MTKSSRHACAPSRRTPRAGATALVATLALALAMPGGASAGRGMENSIMDDQLLLNARTQDRVDRHMRSFVKLGFDRVRVSAFWNQIAPAAQSTAKPAGFDGAEPSSAGYNWTPLDRVVGGAHRHGLGVMISISTPAPLWATKAGDKVRNQAWKPSPAEFADFSEAVVRRYSVTVDRYAIGNEPNRYTWLQPQSSRRAGLIAPHLYRGLVQAAYPRIKRFDPDSVALVGELASNGIPQRGRTKAAAPLPFLRAMACRTERYRRIRRGTCKNFKPVPADAIGHHPYNLTGPPGQHARSRNDAPIADSRRLLRVIDKLTRLGAIKPGNGRRRLNLYFTEFGYQTNPPDIFLGFPLGTQARYLQLSAQIAWRAPRVRELNQFRLTDGAIVGRGPAAYAEFQSGLKFVNGKRKPAFRVFPAPFVIRGGRFWGQARPGGRHKIVVERARRRRGTYRPAGIEAITDTRGYFDFPLAAPRRGYYRYRYRSTDGRGVAGVSAPTLVR